MLLCMRGDSFARRSVAIVCLLICTYVLAYTVPQNSHAYGETAPACVLYEYDGKVEHIFTHELIFDTDAAYSPSNKLRNCFDKDHMTSREFAALLDALYTRGYVLVRLESVLDGHVTVPIGKIPLVMSFDDMTYDTHGCGCVDKLVWRDGGVWDYTAGEEPQYTRERENVTILESFIEKHPDFSYDGGRATLCVNGYNGILGYRITPDCRVSEKVMERDRTEATAFVKELKNLGYSFASHTYYHKYFNSTSASELRKDCRKWREYIAPVVGDTRVLCYPAGEHNAKSAKNKVFGEYGYDVFLCVGCHAETKYGREQGDAKFIYRKPFDGTALRLYRDMYAHLVDTREIYDVRRFRPFSYKGGY